MLKQEPIYGYAIIQRPYFVPISSTSVYMSCYTTINEAAHHYVNGDFLAEKLRIEETEHEVFFGFNIGGFHILRGQRRGREGFSKCLRKYISLIK